METKYKVGLKGQQAAEDWLINKGYTIITRNYRVRTGELDLIVDNSECIAFVEVKYRRGLKFGLPREAVGVTKQKRMATAALQYVADNDLSDTNLRFDVIEVIENGGIMEVVHIENAFELSGF